MRAPYTQLFVHLVWSTWDRLPLIKPEDEGPLYSAIAAKCNEMRCHLIAVNGTADHIHVLTRIPTTISIADLVRHIKGSTSHLINHQIDPHRQFKWQGAYGAFTISKGMVNRVAEYVRGQKQHHAAGELIGDLEREETEESSYSADSIRTTHARRAVAQPDPRNPNTTDGMDEPATQADKQIASIDPSAQTEPGAAQGLLSNKVALVTGAGRGIGRSIALALAREGARVALVARSAGQLSDAQSEIAALGGEAACFPTDVSDEASVITMMRGVIDHFGRLDIAVNNAGIGLYGPLETTSAETWDRVMAVNARGTFLVCREAIPHLRRQRPAFIVNIASVVAVKGYANQSAYSASKHAVLGMSKALARELQADGIRVHVICPGGVDTDMAGQARPDLDRSVLMSPDEIADAVLFLVTRRGKAVIDQIDLRRESATPWA